MSEKTHCDKLHVERKPLNLYGSLEPAIRLMRDHRPMDLHIANWRKNNPDGSYEAWQQQAKKCIMDGLHYHPGELDLKAETGKIEHRDGMIVESIIFNTTPWNRVKGFFLYPENAPQPLPAVLVMHAWGGPMLFGKERVVNTGRDHHTLKDLREQFYSGKYLAEEYVKQGYAVLVIDNYHFGERVPKGLNGVPEEFDPYDYEHEEYKKLEELVRNNLYLSLRQLQWAGTTWTGFNFWDDSRCVDYLQSRPEVDCSRIGCTGLSVGGWRTNILAALDERIKASVSVGWMTTGNYQQIYNLSGAVGSFCLMPGVWDRLDLPDLAAVSAPRAIMVVSGSKDHLFPPEAQQEAGRQIQSAYDWAGVSGKCRNYFPEKPHCYDDETQMEAFKWFNAFL
jgi:dienelactone hydrolase